MFKQMAIIEVPHVDDLAAFQVNFLHEYGVEVPFTQHLTKTFARVSVQAYNDEVDAARLLNALQKAF
jgi:selenocysteine lyase/cysteine desulfurase